MTARHGPSVHIAHVDVETGTAGALGYRLSALHLKGVARDHRWAWIGDFDHEGKVVAIRVERDGRRITTRTAPAGVLAVAPDETAVVISCPDDPLKQCLGGVRSSALEVTARLSMRYWFTRVVGWLPDRSIVTESRLEGLTIDRVVPDRSPVELGKVPSDSHPALSNDASRLAWIRGTSKDRSNAALIVSELADLSVTARPFPLGWVSGPCEFAPGDRHVVCVLADDAGKPQLSIVSFDLHTRNVVTLARRSALQYAISPSGDSVAVASDGTIYIVAIGGGARRKLGIAGFPVAWIR